MKMHYNKSCMLKIVCAKNAMIDLLMHVHNAWLTSLVWRIIIDFMMIVELDGGHMNWGDGMCGLKVGKNKKQWARTKFEATKKNAQLPMHS